MKRQKATIEKIRDTKRLEELHLAQKRMAKAGIQAFKEELKLEELHPLVFPNAKKQYHLQQIKKLTSLEEEQEHIYNMIHGDGLLETNTGNVHGQDYENQYN